RERQLDCRRSARLSLGIAGPGPGPERHGALQVRQRESGLTVAAVLRAQEREQCRVLRDRQELAIAKGPTDRREVKRDELQLPEEWRGHDASLRQLRGG